MSEDGFVEAGKPSIDREEVLAIPNPDSNPHYKRITGDLQRLHSELIKFEADGKLNNAVENPGLIGDYLGKLRLNCNLLFAFWNQYIDIMSDLQQEYASKKQGLYVERLAMPKGTPSAAKNHADEMTRVDNASIKAVENRIQQIKNEYERYNGICMFLQSRLKEFNTERIMG